MSSHSGELKILSVNSEGVGPLAVGGHDTLFTASEVEALNSLSADHSAAKSLERGERLVCREELSVQLWPFTTVKTTKKTKYYTHEEALTLILASSEDSEDSQYDSEREEMFEQQLDDVLDRSMSEDSDADWEPQSQTGRPPAPTPTEGGRQKRQRSHSAATSATSPAASSTATPTTGRSRAARRVRGRGRRGGYRGASRGPSRAPSAATGEQQWRDVGDHDVEPALLDFVPVRQPGPQQQTRVATSPLEFFRLFFTDAVLNTLTANTNAYGAKRHDGKQVVWHNICRADIYSYLAMVIYMGMVKCSTLLDYWRGSRLYSLIFPPSVISRNKFLRISRALHMSDITADEENVAKRGTPAYDRLCKIKPLYSHIVEACKAHFQPGRHISIDERMVASKARISLKQYIKSKPTKWGYKLFVLADSGTGYTWNFFVYEGKSPGYGNGLSYDSVMSLLDFDLLGTGYQLYVDNFYTSSHLFLDLLKKKMGACGTIRANRVGFPKTTINDFTRGTPRGAIKWIRDSELLFVKWMDTREVVMCSTIHKAFTGDTAQRRVKTAGAWEVVHVPIPAAVKDYNQHMGGVDLSDPLIGYYSASHKTMKWYKTFFYHFLDIAIVNAHILYQQCQRGSMTQKEFRHALIEELADLGTPSTSRPSTSQVAAPPNPAASHKPQYLDEQDEAKRDSAGRAGRRICKLCHRKTPVGCSTCGVPLCFVATRDCYNEWHTQQGM
uniref:PiggyBac transposable element-derived protein domain-containing protein n=1 Tax=Gadus morhua TaxID=8049 RepID=A0A8C5BXE2_GADMO